MAESLTVLGNRDLSSMVFEHILSVAGPLFEQAREAKSRIRTAEELLARQKFVKETFAQLVGGFPERAPLNARRLGTLQREGYRVEKIFFESRPQFYVTANLYLPDGVFEPAPAILIPCGHAREAKAYPEYQTLAQGLAKHGFVALVYDPLGQGERSQYWDDVRGDSRIGFCCYEHEVAGDQSLLVGRNLASYRIWDGMRAIDYLCERDEVDTSRIGCTGCSGGGTLTTYLFALDERIAAAMPVCYVTSRDAWLATGMIADAEQVQDRAIELGIDHSDLCFAGAPRALRIGAADHDFFPVEGTRKTFEEAKRMYALLDAEDRVDLCVVPGEHGYLPALREAAYQWFHLWLGNPGADPKEPPIHPEAAEELRCAPGGQVINLGSRTVFCFTRDAALELPPEVPAFATRGDAEDWQVETRERLRELLRVPPGPGAAPCDQHGSFFRGKTGIELLSFQSERGITIPALLFVPEKEGKWPGIVYVHEEGKEAEAGHLGTIQMLANEGNVVLAIDVRGIGESQSADNISRDYKLMGVEGYHFYQYGMLGRSLVGGRVHDVLRSVALLMERPEVNADQVSVVGEGLGGLLALFAAALDERIGTAFCSRTLASYREVATQEYYAYHPRWFVPGILKVCDLSDVAACVAPRRLILGSPLDHQRRRLTQSDAEALYARTRSIYKLFDAEDALHISTDGT